MTVIALERRPDLMDQAAVLMRAIWPDYYGPGGAGDAVTDLNARCRTDGLPFGVLALANDGAAVGTGALQGPSYGSAPGEALWLGGLCVSSEQRNTGIATAIVKALMQHATTADHDAIYATTQTAVSLLIRLGWEPLRRFTDAKGEWRVLRVTLLR